MTIELPDIEVDIAPLTSEQARVDVAVGLYSGRHLSPGCAAPVAGMPIVLLMRESGRRGIYCHYSVDDALHNVEPVREKLGK